MHPHPHSRPRPHRRPRPQPQPHLCACKLTRARAAPAELARQPPCGQSARLATSAHRKWRPRRISASHVESREGLAGAGGRWVHLICASFGLSAARDPGQCCVERRQLLKYAPPLPALAPQSSPAPTPIMKTPMVPLPLPVGLMVGARTAFGWRIVAWRSCGPNLAAGAQNGPVANRHLCAGRHSADRGLHEWPWALGAAAAPYPRRVRAIFGPFLRTFAPRRPMGALNTNHRADCGRCRGGGPRANCTNALIVARVRECGCARARERAPGESAASGRTVGQNK